MWRWTAIAVTTLLALSFLALAANAGHDTASVPSMTACLNTTKGTLTNVAIGDAPKTACATNERVVHFSGGDITAVTAGTGLSGGSASGTAHLNVNFGAFGSCPAGSAIRTVGTTATCQNTTYTAGQGLSLAGSSFGVSSPDCTEPIGPGIETDLVSQWTGTGWSCVNRTYHAGAPLAQVGETFLLSNTGCATGEFWKWNGSAWSCDPDIDTKYFAGSGLQLRTGNIFDLMSCNPGQILRNGGTGYGQAWACADERVGGYEIVVRSTASDSIGNKSLEVFCPSGKKVIGGGASTTAPAGTVFITNSYVPNPNLQGSIVSVWKVQASEINQASTFANWSLTGEAICANVA